MYCTYHDYCTSSTHQVGFELLNSCLTSDPSQRRTALHALESAWFTEEPLPVPLSRAEIKQLKRNRDEAISSGTHNTLTLTPPLPLTISSGTHLTLTLPLP